MSLLIILNCLLSEIFMHIIHIHCCEIIIFSEISIEDVYVYLYKKKMNVREGDKIHKFNNDTEMQNIILNS